MGLAGGFLLANMPRMAAGIVVGSDLLARTGELLSLVVDDVLVCDVLGFASIVRFRETKTGAREGVYQSITIDNEVVRGALGYLCEGLHPGVLLLQVSDLEFKGIWVHAVHCLNLQHLALRPYSMRRGGATWVWRITLSYDSVAHSGSWASISTCRRYVEDAAVHLASTQLSPRRLEHLRALGEVYRRLGAQAFKPDAPGGAWTGVRFSPLMKLLCAS